MYHSGGSPTQGENPILKLISTNRRQLVIGADIIFFKGPTSKLDFIVTLEAKCSVSWKLFSQKDHFLQKKKKKRARILKLAVCDNFRFKKLTVRFAALFQVS